MCRSLSRMKLPSRAMSFLPLTFREFQSAHRDCFAPLAMTANGCHCEERSDEAISTERALLHRHEDAVADLAFDRLRQVPLAGGVLDKDDFAGADDPRFAVAGGDLHAGVEV